MFKDKCVIFNKVHLDERSCRVRRIYWPKLPLKQARRRVSYLLSFPLRARPAENTSLCVMCYLPSSAGGNFKTQEESGALPFVSHPKSANCQF